LAQETFEKAPPAGELREEMSISDQSPYMILTAVRRERYPNLLQYCELMKPHISERADHEVGDSGQYIDLGMCGLASGCTRERAQDSYSWSLPNNSSDQETAVKAPDNDQAQAHSSMGCIRSNRRFH